MKKMTPFLWFDGNVGEAMDFYRSVFPGSTVSDAKKAPDGSVMSATFELDGQRFIAFNGGPNLQLTPVVSMYIDCETQAEVDELWSKLTEGGAESQCGWLTDRFGLSWQIIPSLLPRLLYDRDPEKARRAMDAMLRMSKIEIAELERAAAGA